MRNFFFNLFTLLICAVLPAQSVFFENIDQQYGLPSENIYDIYKDSKGYIWSTSDMGLLRFNGKSFKLFNNDSNLSRSGSYIKEDKFGRIWYQTFDGYFFYVEKNILKQLPSKESSGFKAYTMNSKSLFRIIDEGVEEINLKTLEQNKFIKGNNFVFCQLLDDWLYYGNKTIYRYHLIKKTTEKITHIEDDFKSLVPFSNNKYIAIADRSNPNTPFIIINSNGTINKKKLSLPETLQNVYLLENEIWCFTKNGIYRFDYEMKPLTNFHFLEGKNVSSYTKDSNNFIWIGSPTNGIYLIKDLSSYQFSLTNDEFSSISQKNEKIYTGTNSGKIYEYSSDLKSKLYFNTHENNHILFLDFKSLPNWIFFTGNGFYAQDLKTNKIYRDYASVKHISKINDTLIGIAATGYAGKLDLKAFTKNKHDRKNIIDNLRAKSCVYLPTKDLLIIASNKGLFSIDKKNIVTQILYKNQNLFIKEIVASKDTLWGITNNGRIFYWKNNKVTFLNNDLFFTNIKIFKNTIYLSSKNEIFKIHKTSIQKINNIGNFNTILDFEIINKELYLLTSKKVIKIPVENHIQFKELPRIEIKDITFNGETFSPQKMKRIPYNYNSVNIDFDVINFDYLNEYTFNYLVNNKAYTFEANSHSILLPELQSGEYTIKFKIFNSKTNQLVYTKKGYSFTILLPFWKRWWFILGLVVFALIVLYYIYKIQLNRINKKNRIRVTQLTLENNLKESRLQLIKSQMNPHFFFNAINNIQSYIFTNETKEASLYLSKFSKLTRKILEFSEVNWISLKEEIEALQLYLELQQMRFKDLNFKITIDNISNTEQIKIPTMMFQPYVENAILHGLSHSLNEKKLDIHFLVKNNTLITTITDNGIGRIKSSEINKNTINKPQSFATKANLERIQLLNKDQYKIFVTYTDLYNEANKSLGTQVLIKIEL